jgi:uncharacterized membrane protein
MCIMFTAGLAYALVKSGLHSGSILAILVGAFIAYGIVRQTKVTKIPKMVDELLTSQNGFALMSFIAIAFWTPLLAVIAFLDLGISHLLWSLYGALAATLLVLFLIGRTTHLSR